MDEPAIGEAVGEAVGGAVGGLKPTLPPPYRLFFCSFPRSSVGLQLRALLRPMLARQKPGGRGASREAFPRWSVGTIKTSALRQAQGER